MLSTEFLILRRILKDFLKKRVLFVGKGKEKGAFLKKYGQNLKKIKKALEIFAKMVYNKLN